ncbi:MAG TPA: amidohydrolase [Gemmatimonadota bacterium]|nr:amidohydrolase [Gemmatimonadota bacterium]
MEDRAAARADLVIVDSRVWTGNRDAPWAEAVAVSGERITAVGSRAEIEALVDEDTRVIDAAGGLVTPGFIDSHVHFIDGGERLASVQLRDAATPDEFARRIGEFAATLPPGTWILGGDWDHTLWGGELPRRDWIDGLTAEHPVFVQRLDGHMGLANTVALEAAGVDDATPDVEGGEIVRDADGAPTGLLKDNAMGLVQRLVPDAPEAQQDRFLDAAMAHVAERGVTSVHNVGGWGDLAVFQRAHAAGRLDTRIYACTPIAGWERLRDEIATHGRGDDWLRIGCLKGFVDGSLGSHTAAFLEPFSDAPGERGLLVDEPADLRRWIAGADAAGLQVAVHAIGDRAIRLLLDIFEEVGAEEASAGADGASRPIAERRFRIEHAQHIHPDDIPRFAELGVIASMQPYHAIDDGRWAEDVIGPERARTTYAFRSLLDAGAHVAFGSDWYVAPPTPIEGIYAAVTRRTLDGANPDGWVPEQKITVEEALAAYTRDAAYASFEEDEKGTLEPGKLADLIVLDRDITAIAPEEIADATVQTTIVGGRIVWSPTDEQ